MATPFWLVSLPTWSTWSALRFAGPPGRRATFVGPTGQAKARDGQSNAMMFCRCVIFACRCVSFRLFRLKWIEDLGMKKHIQNTHLGDFLSKNICQEKRSGSWKHGVLRHESLPGSCQWQPRQLPRPKGAPCRKAPWQSGKKLPVESDLGMSENGVYPQL